MRVFLGASSPCSVRAKKADSTLRVLGLQPRCGRKTGEEIAALGKKIERDLLAKVLAEVHTYAVILYGGGCTDL